MPDTLPPALRSDETGEAWLSALERRRSVDPDFLGEPGPSPDQTARLLRIAARVPDHGALEPWRFIVLEGPAREAASARMAEAYAQALASDMADFARENPEKAARQTAKMPKIFARAPLVVVVVSRADPAARHPEIEQLLSAGAVCHNLIVAATAMGFGADWLTGWPAYDPRALAVLGVGPGEKVAGIIHIGTTLRASPERRRPNMAAIATRWTAAD
jgi:nitroreductase